MNLNVSRHRGQGTSPVRYNLQKPKGLPPVFMPSGGTLLNGVIALGALGSAALGAVIVGSGEKFPDVEAILTAKHQREGSGGTGNGGEIADPKTLQSTLEGSLKKYDSLRSQKKFPDELVQEDYHYYTSYPTGLTREEAREQFLDRYRNTTYLGFFTKLDGVIFLHNKAYVQTTTKIRTTAPVRTYVSAFHAGAERTSGSEAPTTSVRYIRNGGVWEQSGAEGAWQVQYEQPISSEGPFVKEENDSVTYGDKWPASLAPPVDIIGARLTALDSARSSGSGDYGKGLMFSNFELDVQGDGDGRGNLLRPTAEWRFKKAASVFDSLEVTTQIKEAVQISQSEIIAIVERRYTWHNPKNGATVTAAREEADFWTTAQGTSDFYLSQTHFLTQSPVLTYAGL